MVNNRKNLAIITARSGSKGLPDKNIKLLNGIPLMAYSIKAAIESGCFDKVFVSTDSEEYASIAKQYGADASFLRSKKNSCDLANSWDVVKEVVGEFEKRGDTFDTVMLLQPTSPLRTSLDIVKSYVLFDDKKASAIIGVVEVEHSPLWCNVLPDNLSMDHFRNEKYCEMPRQLLPKYYRINGAIYLIDKKTLYDKSFLKQNCYAYIMPNERSIDIDTAFDFAVAELMLKSGV